MRRSSSRGLAVFGAVIGLLSIVTLIVVLIVSGRPVELLPGDSPQGIVQRYIIAVEQKDYPAAWGYIAPQPLEKGITYEIWLQSMGYPPEQSTRKATLGEVSFRGDTATVVVAIDRFRYSGPFQDPVNTNYVTFSLQLIGSAWKITDPVYIWWLY
jgi:hypothetical protein